MKIRIGVVLPGIAIAGLAAILASCGRGADSVWTDDSGLLRYVPADTPYLFAQGEAPPDELMDKLVPWGESILAAYEDMFRSMLEQPGFNDLLGPDPQIAEQRETANAVLDAAAELLTADGLENAGITRDSKVVLYGHGLLPVMRLTLSDGALLEAAVARIEEAVGTPAPVATSGAQSYRYWGNESAQLALAIVGDELVVTVAPGAVATRQLGAVFGGELPDESIAASGKLGELAARYEFGPHYAGFLDLERIAATFLDQPSGTDAELLGLMGYDSSSLSDACRAEIRDLSRVAPRFVAGYTTLDGDEMSMNAVLELREDIAAGLATIAAAVPGLGTLREGLFSFGAGVDLIAARAFYLQRLDAIDADPFECEMLGGLQSSIPAARELMNQPVPPNVYDVKGFFFVLDEAGDLGLLASGQAPSEISARLLLAADNAPSLLGMAAMVSPEIAAMRPDGEPVRINVPLPIPVAIETWAALTPSSIGLAIGPNGDARLRALIDAPVADSRPFFSADMDYQRYYQVLVDVMELAAALDPNASASLEPTREMMEQIAAGPLRRSSSEVRFTARGVEMPSTITLGD